MRKSFLGALLLLILTTASALSQPTACESEPLPVTDGAFKVALERDPSTTWQPPGGEVRFSLQGDGIPAPDLQVWVCFRWSGLTGGRWYNTAYPRVVAAGGNKIDVAVTVPQAMKADRPKWLDAAGQQVDRTGFGWTPLADMHVVVLSSGAWKRVDFTQPVGISSKLTALVPALAGPVITCALFMSWGRRRGMKKGLLLSVITGPNGVASLSQFQIMLWTFVFGSGVAYVMGLSGSMIDIPATALGLLGISGVATLGAKLNGSSGSGSAPAPNPPGSTSGLAISGAATDTSVTLTWTPPANADPNLAYVVQVRQHGTIPWSNAATSVATPPFAVTGLTPGTLYDFQVFAVNDAGSGPATLPVAAATTNTGSAAAGAPAPVPGLIAMPGPRASESIKLTWGSATPAPESYVVQSRPAGAWTWSTNSAAATSPWVVDGLDGGTDYEFQVFGITAGQAGAPSPVTAARTGPRTPRWSDLVIGAGTGGEVDVTRTQMLMFTVLTAAFVSMRLFGQSEIPEIPTGILSLMGLSNGVYLAAKFVPSPKG